MIPFRLILISVGILILVINFIFYAIKRMGETYGILWMLIGIISVLVGIIKRDWSAFSAIDNKLLIPLVIVTLVLLLLIFRVTSTLSVLTRQNQELAMHVSLLNQENEVLVKKLLEEKNLEESTLFEEDNKES